MAREPADISRRRLLKWGGGGLALGALGAGTLLDPPDATALDFTSLYRSRSDAGAPAVVAELGGKAFADERPLQIGSKVHHGEQVRVAKTGHLVLTLPDGSAYRLMRGATVELVLQQRRPNAFRLLVGALLSVIPSGRPFTVVGPTATIGVKGTVFFHEVFSDQDRTGFTPEGPQQMPPGQYDYVCACYGSLDVRSNSTSGERPISRSTYHTAFAVEPQRSDFLVTAPYFNHSDRQIAQLVAHQQGPKHRTDWLRER